MKMFKPGHGPDSASWLDSRFFWRANIDHNNSETSVFILGYKPDVPAVRCWLSRTSNAEFWQFGAPEPPPPWLGVALLGEAANLTPDQVLTLGDAERCVAWALLELGIQ